MNYIHKLLNAFLLGFVLIVFLISNGCTKFLTQTDPSNITLDNFYTTAEQAQSVVDATYADLRPIYDGGGFGGSPWLMLEFPTGLSNTTIFGSAGSINFPIRNLSMTADNQYLTTFWRSHYRGIANANVAIAKLPDIEMDENQKNRLLGEARFLRAYYYFNLVRLFGDVPLILEPLDLSSEQLNPKNASAVDIYDAIVDDLEYAENSGLPFTDMNGRVSLGAVKTLMASVYLTMAGYPLQAGSNYYTLAKDKASEIINSDMFYLFNTYADLRNKDAENIGENIFMVQYDESIANRNGFQQLLLPASVAISLYSANTGMIYPTAEFLESYEAGDKRTQEKEFYYREFTLASDRTETVTLEDWFIYKWFDPVAHTETALSGLNWPLFRYAEVLFIFAEASNEIDGPTEDAFNAINAIRERAELTPLSGLNQEEFRKAILLEKWHEMCFENKTWFDMVRLRKAYNFTTGAFDDFVGHEFVFGPILTENNLLFPIPEAEIQNNENLIQNPGY
ncbi:RagB/SusD family nutrient uptake outer membrane protein [Pseudozobellia sp. WGM2]|uniref:RagB/SusD family nutrient uptake outer membrane protein n=1 Tax=Pseudozobellia sp. WGM2 TaxID=2787625 RepID=UPI001ADEFA2C|nr:RagB/SusD family nutrient uptake outer membrane protein [Pseudozobellia sp. WGM2]